MKINNLTADKLRKSILQLAIQGKLVKQNPDDEPASELVKKIYAEKQKLIAEGKKLIVADSTSLTDIEQIALAIKKCDKKLLPTGTAAGAQVLAKYWLAGLENEEEKSRVLSFLAGEREKPY